MVCCAQGVPSLPFEDFVIDNLLKQGHLSLPDTKASARHGRSESVASTDPEVLQFVSVGRAEELPGEKNCTHGSTVFRKRFRQATEALRWRKLHIQPYSLRRGDDTDFFKQTDSMQQVAFQGRWANFRTTKHYVDAYVK